MREVPHVHTPVAQERLLAEQGAEGFASCTAYLVLFDVFVMYGVMRCNDMRNPDVEL